LNQFVGVEKIKAERFRHQPAYGRFAGAHETDERNIGEMTAVWHGGRIVAKRRQDARSNFALPASGGRPTNIRTSRWKKVAQAYACANGSPISPGK
jgi:hypothetical protein